MPWFTGIPLAAAEFFGMHHISTRVLLNHKNYTENVTASPYFAGIIAASIFWVAEAWLTRLLPGTFGRLLPSFPLNWTFIRISESAIG